MTMALSLLLPTRQNPCLIAFFFTTGLVYAQQLVHDGEHTVHSIAGRLTHQTFDTKTNTIYSTTAADFIVHSSGRMIQIQATDPTTNPNRLQILTSDSADIYTSDTFTRTDPGIGPSPSPIAWASFDHGKMPRRMPHWGIMQVLAQAVWLSQDAESCLAGNELKLEYIPEMLERRAKNRAKGIRTHVTQSTIDGLTVEFWTIPFPRVPANSPYRDSFLLAKLTVHSTASRLPTIISFSNLLAINLPDGKLSNVRSSEYLFESQIKNVSGSHSFDDLSVVKNALARVTDYRFKGGKSLPYVLSSGDILPFNGRGRYENIKIEK